MPSPAPLVADTDAARALVVHLAREPIEVAEALYIDPKWRLVGRQRFTGAPAMVMLSIRRLVERGFALRAAHVILAHNHPSGDPAPSASDLRLTRRLADALALLDMPLADHLIVTGATITSFRERGLL